VRRRGISVIITYIIVFAVVITAVGVAFLWGSQELKKMEDQQQLQLSEGFMKNVDTSVNEIIKEGIYSARTFDVDLSNGELYSKSATITLTPKPTGWDDSTTKYNIFNFFGFRQNVISDVVSSAGILSRSGNTIKRVTGTRQAYVYEIYEANVNIAVESEVVYNPKKTSGDQNELQIYVTVYLTDFNFAVGQKKSNMRLRLQNKGYQSFAITDADFPYIIRLIDNDANDGEEYYIELDSPNNRILIKYLPSYATMATSQRIILKTILLPKSTSSCDRTLYDCWYFKVLRTSIDANMGVVV
jgi:hypothetical protein